MEDKIIHQAKKDVAYFMRRLYTKNLTTTSGGNISLRIDNETVAITPSQLDKGRTKKEQIAIMKTDGINLTPDLKPSIETELHLSIYRKRTDVQAIVHAHPVFSSSFTATQKKINCQLIAESRAIIGDPVYTKYALMGTKNLAEIVSDASLKGNVMMLQNHGILAVGKSLLQAFDRVEVLEASAKMTLITDVLNDKKELSSKQLLEIDNLFK